MALVLSTIIGAVVFTIFQNYFLHPTNNTVIYVIVFVISLICFNVAAIIYLMLYPLISPLRHFPTIPQKPAYQRFFQEYNDWDSIPLVDLVPNNGLVRAFDLFNQEILLATSPEVVKDVLVTNANVWAKSSDNDAVRLVIGDSLITAQGAEHKKQRKALQPAFKYRHILELYPLFWSKSREMLKSIAEDTTTSGSNVIDIQEWISRMALDVIGIGGLGVDFHAITKPQSPFLLIYRKLFSRRPDYFQVIPIIVGLLPGWLIMQLPLKAVKEIRQAVSAIRQIIQELMEAKRVTIMKKPEKAETGKGVLDVIMRSNVLTEREMVDHSMTIMAAGHDTIGYSLTAALIELSLNKDLQDSLRHEIRSNLPSPQTTESINSAVVDKLPLLSAICNEIFRFRPATPGMSRTLTAKNTTIAGHKVPKGTKVFIRMPLFNLNKAFWSGSRYDPGEFHPERWFKEGSKAELNSSGGATDTCSFMTFSHGPRTCIGERFARGEMAVLLAGLIGRFDVTFQGASGRGKPMEELHIRHYIVSHVVGGFWVTMKEVEGW